MSNTNNNMVQIPYDQLVAHSESAALFQFGDQQEWIPNSLISDDEDGYIEVPEWIAIEKGLDGIAEPVE